MTPTPPVPEMASRRACECDYPDPVMQADSKFYCHTCSFETGARPAHLEPEDTLRQLTTERLARQQAERDWREQDRVLQEIAGMVYDEHVSGPDGVLQEVRLAFAERDQLQQELHREVLTLKSQLTLSEQARAQAEQARARLRTALEDAVESMEIAENAYPNVLGHSLKIARAALTVPQATTTDETPH